MAKSSKKQCRKTKPPRPGGGLVVVSARSLQAHNKQLNNNHNNTHSKPPDKGKSKRQRQNMLSELLDTKDGTDNDSFYSPFPVSAMAAASEVPPAAFIFASARSRQQRLYYLLTTCSRAAEDANGGGGHGVMVSEEGGCHSVVFVETTTLAQELLAELKALTLTVFAIHERTPKPQVYLRSSHSLTSDSSKLKHL